MNLSREQTDRFYRIWFALLKFVNDDRHIIAKMPLVPTQGSVKVEDAVKIRDVLWKHDSYLDKFITENPQNFSTDDLDLVASWKNHVTGNFYVLQHLKKYSIFFSETAPGHAYGVVGLISPFVEVVGPYLPILVQTTLIPFGDQITYDGLLSGYNVGFGSGIRADMKLWLRDAEEREGIITALTLRENSAAELNSQARARNLKLIAEYRKSLYKSGLSPKMVEQHAVNIQTFVEFLSSQNSSCSLLELDTDIVDTFLKERNAKDTKVAVTSFKRFTRFLWDTGRSDPDTLDALAKFLKTYQREK